jgi:creatinine amidohydrolase
MSADTGPRVYQDMTWEEISAAASADLPVVIPIGATEQHGRHLPV